MKVKIIIEETISKEFEVEVMNMENAYDQIRGMYKDGTLVVEDPNLIDAQLAILDDEGKIASWDCLL